MRYFFVFLFIFSSILSGCGQQEKSGSTTANLFAPQKPKLTGDPIIDAGKFGDVMNPDFATMFKDPSLFAVTREYGYSVVKAKKYPLTDLALAAQLKPWSSWWYPKKEPLLFPDALGNPSALTKSDMLHRTFKPTAGSAAEYERQKFSPQSAMWEGLCDAWSFASLAKPEPKRPVKIPYADGSGSVTFTVADLKGLALMTYEAVDDTVLSYFGQKFSGGPDGWIFPDIFPEQFHRFIEVQLFENKKPFVMDHDSGVEVWNVPVFKANYKMDLVPNEPNSLFVRMWLYSAESVLSTEKNFVGTKQSVREYDYVLQGVRDNKGNLVITSGYWVKGPDGIDSRNDHPDYMIQISDPSKLVQKSWNPEIDVELVNAILEKSY